MNSIFLCLLLGQPEPVSHIDLPRQLAAVQQELQRLNEKLDAVNKRFEVKLPAVQTAVKIVNHYPHPVTIQVNGQDHPLPAYVEKTVPLNPGPVQYQVAGHPGTAQKTDIKQGQIITITVR